MQFSKYNSIRNHTQAKFIENIISQGYSAGRWVATEKIHGANFSFWTDGVDLHHASRSGFLNDTGIYSSRKLDIYNIDVVAIYTMLLKAGDIVEGDTVAVFGEIYGGNFFGDKEEGSKTVQNGVHYYSGTDFQVFDIAIIRDGNWEDKEYLPFLTVASIVFNTKLKAVPVIGIGTFEEMLKLENEFNSHIPEDHGKSLPEGESNICEGLVIRPYAFDAILHSGHRVIVKSKNEKFSEVDSGRVKKVITTEFMSEDNEIILEALNTYFTVNRLEGVISKGVEAVWKNFSKLSGLYVQDAIEEFSEQANINLRDTVGDDWKLLNKSLMAEAQAIVRDYLKVNAEV